MIRTVYDINQFMSDIGGVMRVIISIVGVVLLPITKHQFSTILTKRLFLVRTQHSDIFQKLKKDHNGSHYEQKFEKYIDSKHIPCDYDADKKREIN